MDAVVRQWAVVAIQGALDQAFEIQRGGMPPREEGTGDDVVPPAD